MVIKDIQLNLIKPNSSKATRLAIHIRANKKGTFSAPLNWILSPQDYKMIEDYAKSKIK